MWYCVSVNKARSKQPFCLSFLLIVFLSYPTGRLADGKIEKQKTKKENSYWIVDVLLCIGERSKFYKASDVNRDSFEYLLNEYSKK